MNLDKKQAAVGNNKEETDAKVEKNEKFLFK